MSLIAFVASYTSPAEKEDEVWRMESTTCPPVTIHGSNYQVLRFDLLQTIENNLSNVFSKAKNTLRRNKRSWVDISKNMTISIFWKSLVLLNPVLRSFRKEGSYSNDDVNLEGFLPMIPANCRGEGCVENGQKMWWRNMWTIHYPVKEFRANF